MGVPTARNALRRQRPLRSRRKFYIIKEEAEQALYKKQRTYRQWGVKTLMWYVTKHGESVKYVLSWWGIVIATGGILFSGLGSVKNSAGMYYAITSPTELGTIAGAGDTLESVF